MSVTFSIMYAWFWFLDTSDSVSVICWRTGFNTLSNFNRLFRKRKGCSPTEFREKYQKTKVIV